MHHSSVPLHSSETFSTSLDESIYGSHNLVNSSTSINRWFQLIENSCTFVKWWISDELIIEAGFKWPLVLTLEICLYVSRCFDSPILSKSVFSISPSTSFRAFPFFPKSYFLLFKNTSHRGGLEVNPRPSTWGLPLCLWLKSLSLPCMWLIRGTEFSICDLPTLKEISCLYQDNFPK